jgi:hypothetical protein
VISWALFPQVARKFFEARRAGVKEIPLEFAAAVAAAVHHAASARNGHDAPAADGEVAPGEAWKRAGRWDLMRMRAPGRG